MPRPKLDSRFTIRLPEELLTDLGTIADRRKVSVNEVVLCSLENDIARMLTCRLDYYAQLRALAAICLGDSGRRTPSVSDLNQVRGKVV